MKGCLSVRPSECLSQHGLSAANPLLHVGCCGSGEQEISIDCCSGSDLTLTVSWVAGRASGL